ncbi:MAG: DotI/IcmL/TraM family protein, partial [Pseudomonadota bacterium]
MAEQISTDAVETVMLRNGFYRDSYRRVMLVLLLAIMLIVGLSVVLGYLITHPPEPKYFATTIDGRITPLIPLSQPNTSTSALLQW